MAIRKSKCSGKKDKRLKTSGSVEPGNVKKTGRKCQPAISANGEDVPCVSTTLNGNCTDVGLSLDWTISPIRQVSIPDNATAATIVSTPQGQGKGDDPDSVQRLPDDADLDGLNKAGTTVRKSQRLGLRKMASTPKAPTQAGKRWRTKSGSAEKKPAGKRLLSGLKIGDSETQVNMETQAVPTATPSKSPEQAAQERRKTTTAQKQALWKNAGKLQLPCSTDEEGPPQVQQEERKEPSESTIYCVPKFLSTPFHPTKGQEASRIVSVTVEKTVAVNVAERRLIRKNVKAVSKEKYLTGKSANLSKVRVVGPHTIDASKDSSNTDINLSSGESNASETVKPGLNTTESKAKNHSTDSGSSVQSLMPDSCDLDILVKPLPMRKPQKTPGKAESTKGTASLGVCTGKDTDSEANPLSVSVETGVQLLPSPQSKSVDLDSSPVNGMLSNSQRAKTVKDTINRKGCNDQNPTGSREKPVGLDLQSTAESSQPVDLDVLVTMSPTEITPGKGNCKKRTEGLTSSKDIGNGKPVYTNLDDAVHSLASDSFEFDDLAKTSSSRKQQRLSRKSKTRQKSDLTLSTDVSGSSVRGRTRRETAEVTSPNAIDICTLSLPLSKHATEKMDTAALECPTRSGLVPEPDVLTKEFSWPTQLRNKQMAESSRKSTVNLNPSHKNQKQARDASGSEGSLTKKSRRKALKQTMSERKRSYCKSVGMRRSLRTVKVSEHLSARTTAAVFSDSDVGRDLTNIHAHDLDTDFLDNFASRFDNFDSCFPEIDVCSVERNGPGCTISLTCDLTIVDRKLSPCRQTFEAGTISEDTQVDNRLELEAILRETITRVENIVSSKQAKLSSLEKTKGHCDSPELVQNLKVKQFCPHRKRKFSQISVSVKELPTEQPPSKRLKLDDAAVPIPSAVKNCRTEDLIVEPNFDLESKQCPDEACEVSFSTPDHDIESPSNFSLSLQIDEEKSDSGNSSLQVVGKVQPSDSGCDGNEKPEFSTESSAGAGKSSSKIQRRKKRKAKTPKSKATSDTSDAIFSPPVLRKSPRRIPKKPYSPRVAQKVSRKELGLSDLQEDLYISSQSSASGDLGNVVSDTGSCQVNRSSTVEKQEVFPRAKPDIPTKCENSVSAACLDSQTTSVIPEAGIACLNTQASVVLVDIEDSNRQAIPTVNKANLGNLDRIRTARNAKVCEVKSNRIAAVSPVYTVSRDSPTHSVIPVGYKSPDTHTSSVFTPADFANPDTQTSSSPTRLCIVSTDDLSSPNLRPQKEVDSDNQTNAHRKENGETSPCKETKSDDSCRDITNITSATGQNHSVLSLNDSASVKDCDKVCSVTSPVGIQSTHYESSYVSEEATLHNPGTRQTGRESSVCHRQSSWVELADESLVSSSPWGYLSPDWKCTNSGSASEDNLLTEAVKQHSGINLLPEVRLKRLPRKRLRIGNLEFVRKGKKHRRYWKVINLRADSEHRSPCPDNMAKISDCLENPSWKNHFSKNKIVTQADLNSEDSLFTRTIERRSKTVVSDDDSDAEPLVSYRAKMAVTHPGLPLNDSIKAAVDGLSDQHEKNEVSQKLEDPIVTLPNTTKSDSRKGRESPKKKTLQLTDFELAISKPASDTKNRKKAREPMKRARRKSSEETVASVSQKKVSSNKVPKAAPSVDELNKFSGPLKSKIARKILRQKAEEEVLKNKPKVFDVEEPRPFLEMIQPKETSNDSSQPPVEPGASVEQEIESLVESNMKNPVIHKQLLDAAVSEPSVRSLSPLTLSEFIPPPSPTYSHFDEDSADGNKESFISPDRSESTEKTVEQNVGGKEELSKGETSCLFQYPSICASSTPLLGSSRRVTFGDPGVTPLSLGDSTDNTKIQATEKLSKAKVLEVFDDILADINFNPVYDIDSDDDSPPGTMDALSSSEGSNPDDLKPPQGFTFGVPVFTGLSSLKDSLESQTTSVDQGFVFGADTGPRAGLLRMPHAKPSTHNAGSCDGDEDEVSKAANDGQSSNVSNTETMSVSIGADNELNNQDDQSAAFVTVDEVDCTKSVCNETSYNIPEDFITVDQTSVDNSLQVDESQHKADFKSRRASVNSLESAEFTDADSMHSDSALSTSSVGFETNQLRNKNEQSKEDTPKEKSKHIETSPHRVHRDSPSHHEHTEPSSGECTSPNNNDEGNGRRSPHFALPTHTRSFLERRKRTWQNNTSSPDQQGDDDTTTDDDDDAVSIYAPSEASFLFDRDICLSPERNQVLTDSPRKIGRTGGNKPSVADQSCRDISQFRIPLKSRNPTHTNPAQKDGGAVEQPKVTSLYCPLSFFRLTELLPNRICKFFLTDTCNWGNICNFKHVLPQVERRDGYQEAVNLLDKYCKEGQLQNAVKAFYSAVEVMDFEHPSEAYLMPLMRLCFKKGADCVAKEILDAICLHKLLTPGFCDELMMMFSNKRSKFREHMKKLFAAVSGLKIQLKHQTMGELIRVYEEEKAWVELWEAVDYCPHPQLPSDLISPALTAVTHNLDVLLPLARKWLASSKVEELMAVSKDVLRALNEECRAKEFTECSEILSKTFRTLLDPRRDPEAKSVALVEGLKTIPLTDQVKPDPRVKIYLQRLQGCFASPSLETLSRIFIDQCRDGVECTHPHLFKVYTEIFTSRGDPAHIANSFCTFLRTTIANAPRDVVLDVKCLVQIGVELMTGLYMDRQLPEHRKAACDLVFTMMDQGLDGIMLDTCTSSNDTDVSIMALELCLQFGKPAFAYDILNKCMCGRIGKFLSPSLSPADFKHCYKLFSELLRQMLTDGLLQGIDELMSDVLINFTGLTDEKHLRSTAELMSDLMIRLLKTVKDHNGDIRLLNIVHRLFDLAVQHSVPLSHTVCRTLILACAAQGSHSEAEPVYRECKRLGVYPSQNCEEVPRCITLDSTLTLFEMGLIIMDYLGQVSQLQQMAKRPLVDADFELEVILISQMERVTGLPFLSEHMPKSPFAAQQVLLEVLREKLELVAQSFSTRLVKVEPCSLRAYLRRLYVQGQRLSGRMHQGVVEEGDCSSQNQRSNGVFSKRGAGNSRGSRNVFARGAHNPSGRHGSVRADGPGLQTEYGPSGPPRPNQARGRPPRRGRGRH